MQKIIFLLALIFLPFLSFSQNCIINPTANLVFVSGSGGNCTYNFNLQVTTNTNSVKWITFNINGTNFCYRSIGGSFVLDNTCGTATNGTNIGNMAVNLTLNTNFTLPCLTSPLVIFTGSNSVNNNGNICDKDTFALITPTPFPVKLKSFESNATHQQIDLKWSSSNEINFDKFEIQKSFDAKSFENIGTLKSVLENHNYFFSDIFPKIGHNYYRLKMLDLDGSFTYSKIINEVFIPNNSPAYNVFPNPSKNKKILIKQNLTKNQIKIYTISGQMIDFEVNVNEFFTEIFLKNKQSQNEVFVSYILNQKLYTEIVILE